MPTFKNVSLPKTKITALLCLGTLSALSVLQMSTASTNTFVEEHLLSEADVVTLCGSYLAQEQEENAHLMSACHNYAPMWITEAAVGGAVGGLAGAAAGAATGAMDGGARGALSGAQKGAMTGAVAGAVGGALAGPV